MTQRELTPAQYLAMLRRRWVLILVFALVGGPLAYGVSRFLPNRYESRTLVLVEEQTVSPDIVKGMATDFGARLATMTEQILSRTRLESLVHQFGPYGGELNNKSPDELVERLHDAIRVEAVRPMAETRTQGLPGFTITVTLDNPRTAQGVCTAVTSMFIEEDLRVHMQHSEDTTQFLSQQLAEAKARLDEQDSRLAAFKSRYIGSLPDEEQTNLNILNTLNSQLDAATQALARAQQDKSFAESMLTQQLASWQASQTGRSPETLEQQLAALETQLRNLQGRYTDDYPDVIKTQKEIAALQKQIAQKEDQHGAGGTEVPSKTTVEPVQVAQLRAQLHQYDEVIAEKTKEQDQTKRQIKVYQDRVQSSPLVEQQYKEVTRGYQTALDSFNDLLKRRDQAAMTTDLERKQEGEHFNILDPANLPDKPSFPNRPLFALGGLGGGLALGVGLAFLMEMRDSSLRTERDVEFYLRLPVLGMIPMIEPVASGKLKQAVVQQAAKASTELGLRS